MQVSVIIPTYNRVNDLDRCLDSIIVQTKLPKEVLVIDNGTDVGTKYLVEKRKKEFEGKGISLFYVKNEIENSVTLAKNIGVEYSTGEIISFLDDDLILDKSYTEEIIKVYEKIPNALGVMGYNYSPTTSKGALAGLKRTFIKSFQIIFFREEGRCRVLPSLCLTYPYLHMNKIVSCEWLSGASTYKRSILEEVKSDENLKKYSWNQDPDLSYRIFRKHSNSLFLTTDAKYWHEKSTKGRNTPKELIYMAEVYDLYLFYKNIDQTLKNKLIYLRSRIGRLVLNIALALKWSKSKLTEIKYLIDAPFYCIKHKKDIKEGNLEFFNRELSI